MLDYLSDRAIVALEWTPDCNVLYSVSGIPQTSVSFTGNTTVQLTVFYNTMYNISVVATRCGQNTTVVELKLGNDHMFVLCMPMHLIIILLLLMINVLIVVKCRSPTDTMGDSVIAVTDRLPFVEGSNVSLSCPAGLVFTGASRSTCMENGEWEPDLRAVACKGIIHYSIFCNHVLHYSKYNIIITIPSQLRNPPGKWCECVVQLDT